MCRAFEEVANEAANEAAKKTKFETEKRERSGFANILWDMGIHNLSEIAKKVNLSEDEVKRALGTKLG